jgi:hypothetical protein
MKLNWRVVIALVVLVGAIIWGVDSFRTRLYSGTDLNFGVGSGPVTVTNPSDSAFPVQLIGTRRGTFTVRSSIGGVSGRSTSQGSGSTTTQLFEFVLPSGVSEFTVMRSEDVDFVTNTEIPLEVAVQPLNAEDSRTTLIVAVIAILGSLFYLSRSNGHRWISAARRKEALAQAAAQESERQNFKRIYGHAPSDKS